ncbi:MAG: hypothetical protein AAFN94_15040 [Pseudomonadota bacterium]
MTLTHRIATLLCASCLGTAALAQEAYPPETRSLVMTIKQAPPGTACAVANARGKAKVRNGSRIRIRINGYPGSADILCQVPDGQTITLTSNKTVFKRSTHNRVREGDVEAVTYDLRFSAGMGTARTVTRYGTFDVILIDNAVRDYVTGQGR